MSRTTCWRAVPIMTLAAFLAIASCKESGLAPFEPEITSVTDNFQLQATDVTGVSGLFSYNWPNTGTRAKVTHSTSTTAGTARVIIRDDSTTVVYDEPLVPSLEEPTTTGKAGSWRIQLELEDYSGTLNFRVQKL